MSTDVKDFIELIKGRRMGEVCQSNRVPLSLRVLPHSLSSFLLQSFCKSNDNRVIKTVQWLNNDQPPERVECSDQRRRATLNIHGGDEAGVGGGE